MLRMDLFFLPLLGGSPPVGGDDAQLKYSEE